MTAAVRIALLVVLAFAAFLPVARAQEETPEEARIRVLYEEAAALFNADKLDEAVAKYAEAARALEVVRGTDADPVILALRRAMLWCRARSVAPEPFEQDLAVFLAIDAKLGGVGREQVSVMAAACQMIEGLAKKGDRARLDAWLAAVDGQVAARIQAAEADPATKPQVEQLAQKRGALLADHAGALYDLGDPKAGRAAYERCDAYWMGRGDAVQRSWVAQNVYYHLSLSDRTDDAAAWLFARTLELQAAHRSAEVDAYLAANLARHLERLVAAGKLADGERFLERAIELGRPHFVPSFGEPWLRELLAAHLATGTDHERTLANALAWAKTAVAAGDRRREALAHRAAGAALVALGRPAEALDRYTEADAAAVAGGHALGRGEIAIDRAAALLALGRRDESGAAAAAALAIFETLDFWPGVTSAHQAAVRAADPAKPDPATPAHTAALAAVTARGGMGGELIGCGSAEALIVAGQDRIDPIPLLRVAREGDELVVTNLVSGEQAKLPLGWRMRHVNLAGAVLQIRGPEIALVSLSPDQDCPGNAGETLDQEAGALVHRAPRFAPFAPRELVMAGRPIVVLSSGLLAPDAAK